MDNKTSKSQPLVSAIITTHNRIDLLKRAVKSVEEQTYPAIELIVVDDASTDGTKEWCESQEFTYIHIPAENSRGGNYARNLGIKAAKGKYVAFLDDDDMWYPEKTSKQVDLIETKNCEIVYCGRRLEILKDGSFSYAEQLPGILNCGDMSKRVLQTICTTTSEILVRRESLETYGLFDENLGFWQEYELTIRLLQHTSIYYVNEPLVLYRIDIKDKGRLTNKYTQWKQAVKYIYEKHVDLYSQLSFREKMNVHLLRWGDARIRCMASGLKFKSYGYYLLFRIGQISRLFMFK